MKNKLFYSWEQLERDVDFLVKQLKFASYTHKNIYGVPRGGLVLAVILSHQLKLPLILTASKISNQTLIIDDISDTGKTLKKIMKKGSTVVTLWTTPHTKVVPDFYANVLKKDEWVVFPFETLETSKRDNK